MNIIVALLMTAVVLYCIMGCLMIKKCIREMMNFILELDAPILFLLLPPCVIVAFVFWPFVLAWESIENAK